MEALYTVAGIVNYDLSVFGTELSVIEYVESVGVHCDLVIINLSLCRATLVSLTSEIESLIAPILAYLTPLVASLVTPLDDLLWNNLAAVLGLA